MSLTRQDIDQLFAQAQARRAQGDSAGYVRTLENIIAQHEDPRALNALGNHLLNSGNISAGRNLLERAVKVDPHAPPLWFNLSLACRAQLDSAAEIEALSRTLTLDPYFIQAMIHKGQALERGGNKPGAAHLFKDALTCAAAQPELAARLPAALLDIARAGNEAHAAALDGHLRGTLEAIRARYGGADSDRFTEMLNIFYGRSQYQVQRPTFLPFPQLPPIGFHPREAFPWLEALEAASDDMRAELQTILASDAAAFEPYIRHPQGKPLAQWKELNHDPRWSAYHLIQNGARVEDHIARCPKTMAVLDAAPLADVPDNAPNAFFSVLKPQTRIPPHTGMTNTRLVVHVPLIVPEHCGFRVGNQSRVWEVGKAWVFDDTIEHEAWNLSDQTRIILIVDIWNPHLSALEKDLICAFFDGLNIYNEGVCRL